MYLDSGFLIDCHCYKYGFLENQVAGVVVRHECVELIIDFGFVCGRGSNAKKVNSSKVGKRSHLVVLEKCPYSLLKGVCCWALLIEKLNSISFLLWPCYPRKSWFLGIAGLFDTSSVPNQLLLDNGLRYACLILIDHPEAALFFFFFDRTKQQFQISRNAGTFILTA